jgi:iron complex outermembrane receptor protein
VSQRYGDIENKEKIDAYTLVDLNLSYAIKNIWTLEEVSFGLSFTNLFNQKYISIIKNDQDATQALSTSYYPGAPFTAIASIGIKY